MHSGESSEDSDQVIVKLDTKRETWRNWPCRSDTKHNKTHTNSFTTVAETDGDVQVSRVKPKTH